MPGTTFLPSQDRALLAWATTLSDIVSQSPQTYGVSVELAASFAERVASYADALEACDPSIRSRVSTAGKNIARAALKSGARGIVNFIKAQPSITSDQLIALGLTVPQGPSPISPPALAPFVKVLSVTGRVVRVQLCDGASSTRRGRPPGVIGASVFSGASETEPLSLSEMKFEGNVGRTVIEVEFSSTVAPGMPVWIVALWFTGRKQFSPASRAACTTLQAGMTGLRAA